MSVSYRILDIQYRVEILRGVKRHLEQFVTRLFSNLEPPFDRSTIIEVADYATTKSISDSRHLEGNLRWDFGMGGALQSLRAFVRPEFNRVKFIGLRMVNGYLEMKDSSVGYLTCLRPRDTGKCGSLPW